MNQPLTIKIDVTKIDKSRLFKGKNGTYLDAVIWPNRDGDDKYGNSCYIVQSISKEERAAGVKGAIIGNGRPMRKRAEKQAPEEPQAGEASEDGVPF